MMDLVVWAMKEGGEDSPGKVVDGEKEQYHRLAKLTKKYHAGKIPAIDWLDRLAFAEMERIGQREKAASAKMYLNIEFPQTVDTGLPVAVVYFEVDIDIFMMAHHDKVLLVELYLALCSWIGTTEEFGRLIGLQN